MTLNDNGPGKKRSFLRRLSFSKPHMDPLVHAAPPVALPGGPSKRAVTNPLPLQNGSYRAEPTSISAHNQSQSGSAWISNGVERLHISEHSINPRDRQPIQPLLASPPRHLPDPRHPSSQQRQAIQAVHGSPPRHIGVSLQTSPTRGISSARPNPSASPPANRSSTQITGKPDHHPTRTSSRHGTPPQVSQPFLRSGSVPPPGNSVSEASAYAQAHRTPSRKESSSVPPQLEKRLSRPLPRPPSHSQSPTRAEVGMIPKSRPSPITATDVSAIAFARSPTLPGLIDPRLSPQSRRRRPKRLDLTFTLSHPKIQAALLPHLNINTFLSLTGATRALRKQFNGEIVGRWVLKEWGVRVEHEKGRSWPNLTVWEGFLESLLHDPATYSTYPQQWHSLLQHLCLSYTLIVLHLRNLPSSAFPNAVLPFDEDGEPTATAPAPRQVEDVGKMARHERMVELVMPSPLANAPVEAPQLQRRASILSLASTKSSRKRSNSMVAPSIMTSTGPPPVAYPMPKRYGFKREGQRSRASSISGRPGSVFSFQSGPSIQPPRNLRASFASSAGSRMSPVPRPFTRAEPIFDRPPPFVLGRAPVLRVFVPLSERVPRWPSAEGALWTLRELDKCGATKRLRLGDLVVNTAIPRPRATEHILVFIPYVKHLLVPLEYSCSAAGHLPSYVDAFTLPPSYYYPLLQPVIVFINLAPYVTQAIANMRLAFDHNDVTVSSGAKVSAKRYIHVSGFEITQAAAQEWCGMVSLESAGTAEGKAEMEKRLGWGDPGRVVRGPWEVVREKSMSGNIWLRLYSI